MKAEIIYDQKSDLWLAVDNHQDLVETFVSLEEAMEAQPFKIDRESYKLWKISHKRRVKERGFT
jgi:hypothetical protein